MALFSFASVGVTPGLMGWLPKDFERSFVASQLPTLKVDSPTGSYHQWTKADLLRSYDTNRAEGGEANRVRYGISESTYLTRKFALKHIVTRDDKRRAGVAGINDLRGQTARALMYSVLMDLDREFADLWFAASKWSADATTPTTKWDVSGSDPQGDVGGMIDTIAASLPGRAEDTFALIVGNRDARVLRRHAQFQNLRGQLIDGLRYVDDADLSRGLGVSKLIVGAATRNTAAENATASYSALFDDGAVVVRLGTTVFDTGDPTGLALLVDTPFYTRFYTDVNLEPEDEWVEVSGRVGFVVPSTTLGMFLPNVRSA